MKRHTTLTAGELRKQHGKECRVETGDGDICEGKITVDEDGYVYVCHNNIEADGIFIDDKMGYEYSRYIYGPSRDNNYSSNYTYNWIEIDLDQENEIKPGDLVGVDDYSQEGADEEFRGKEIYYYVGKTREGMFVVENINGYVDIWKYISNKKPEEKKKVTLELTDEQLEEVKKIIN